MTPLEWILAIAVAVLAVFLFGIIGLMFWVFKDFKTNMRFK